MTGRVWMGHNIDNFDCVRLREAYAQIKRAPPEPKRTIDTLPLLTRTFGRRAGNMKVYYTFVFILQEIMSELKMI